MPGVMRNPELSVMGLDDIEVSGYLIPALSTIRQPFAELATQAIRLLLEVIQGKPYVMETGHLVADPVWDT